ncbi:MerR family transcriptional regulator [Kitasatospora sp. NPDC088346]|uniref:MerR family transcriptional regulator n=1 Tax=Kitasatospora sp. NPDC088346 TaxID=3364073 RepID=UPI00382A9ED7
MRIGELSSRTGVPVPTIKYYLREGLLPAGELTSPNQAQYGDTHVHRLKLVRAMIDVGRLSIASAREVLAALDTPGRSLHDTLGVALGAVTAPTPATGVESAGESTAREQADRAVEKLVDRLGWQVTADSPARQALAQVIVAFHTLGQDELIGLLDDYAAAAERLAAAEVAAVATHPDPDGLVESAVIGTVLGDAALAALRRLAQENASHRLFAARPPAPAHLG